ncbi:Hypothetical predicted protein [Lecanosticta acicola]|uniref:Arrestin C-terminal-like domain-containing protein n=1 Tax=Lecanosticta acicola TaxID=111012 RepID=A0AAI8YUJ7_9PEZI|nr:Hypothetical predicted protein [Lecanosticta acicola]
MVPTPRSHYAGSRSNKPWLEIVPDTRFIVFHGTEHESNSVKLKGVVRLHTSEAISILKPKVRLEGKRRIQWWFMAAVTAGEQVCKGVFWNEEQKLGIESAHKIKAGTIEWPFEFELSPAMPESVEGLPHNYIVYHLHASVSRPGWNAKDLMAQEHIRIVRTLGQDSMEMTRSRVNADIWANKISYSISIPTDAIVFGTSITADVELSPIKKGLRLGKVELRLMETVVKRVTQADDPNLRADRQKTEENEVAKADMDFPEDSRVMYDDESIDNPVLADEMYKFQATLPLPKSLNVCRQDVDNHNINVSHRFKLMVNIHNPEGHVSQLVCRLPVKLFISPNLPVDERNEVSASPINGVSEGELNRGETQLVAPPEYGRHQLDQMYSDIDVSGFMSRAGSGPNTPAGIFAQSRRGSHENVLSINGVADSDPSIHHGSAMPSLLRSRLADLQESNGNQTGYRQSQVTSRNHSPSGGNSPAPGMESNGQSTHDHSPERCSSHPRLVSLVPNGTGSYFPSTTASAGQSPHGSAPLSRRASDEHNPEIHAQDYDMDNLSRVPSYAAALRTPGAITPFTQGPPSYVEATSRPPSRAGSPIQRPGQAHVRSGTSSPQPQPSGTPNALGALGNLSLSSPTAPHPPTHEEADARLRMLRART